MSEHSQNKCAWCHHTRLDHSWGGSTDLTACAFGGCFCAFFSEWGGGDKNIDETPASISHMAGAPIYFGTQVRQLCQWCGYRIIDQNLALVAVRVDDGNLEFPTWKIGGWVEITGANTRMYSSLEIDRVAFVAPENSCMRLPDDWPTDVVYSVKGG